MGVIVPRGQRLETRSVAFVGRETVITARSGTNWGATRVAIVVFAPEPQGLREEIQAGDYPRRDYLDLAEALDAKLITSVICSSKNVTRLSRLLGIFTTAWAAFRQRDEYDLIVSDVDRLGMALALLFKISRARKRHIVICHGVMTHPLERIFFKLFRLNTHIDHFVCYGPCTRDRLEKLNGVTRDRITTVRHAADHRFWRDDQEAPEILITGAGKYQRDYKTLMEATRGLDVPMVIAAYSPWMAPQRFNDKRRPELSNVQFVQLSYRNLRDLYARSLIVAIPLVENRGGQAGSMVIYEAMAMGKAVVATRTEGQAGLKLLRDQETGIFVEPGDVEGWRSAISYLCTHPEIAEKMGKRARTLVEDGLNLETYVKHMVRIIKSVSGEDEYPDEPVVAASEA